MLTHDQQMLRDTARAAFWGGWEGSSTFTDTLAMRKNSTSDQETYVGFGHVPGVREMRGGRQPQSVPAYNFTIVNKQWESSVPVSYMTWKYNKNNDVPDLLSGMGSKAREYPQELATGVLNDNTATGGYDNLALFHTSHVDPSAPYTTAQDNALTTNITAPDLANGGPTDLEFAAAVRAMISKLYGYKDGFGTPWWVGQNMNVVVMVPTDYLEICRRVMTADSLTGALGNDLKGQFTMLVNPYLTAPTSTHGYFYAINASSKYRPVIHQVVEDVSIDDDMGGDNNFNTKDVTFGTFAIYNAGPGQWRTIVREDFT